MKAVRLRRSRELVLAVVFMVLESLAVVLAVLVCFVMEITVSFILCKTFSENYCSFLRIVPPNR